MQDFFSDRTHGKRPTERDKLDPVAAAAFGALVQRLLSFGAFGDAFPVRCPDGAGIIDNDDELFWRTAAGLIPGMDATPSRWNDMAQEAVFDLLEYCHVHVAEPDKLNWHGFFQHHHLGFDRAAGQAKFRGSVNEIFARNGIAFKMDGLGKVRQEGAQVLGPAITAAIFDTGDLGLDQHLERAREKFLAHAPESKLDALRELWDAFERLKTLVGYGDKASTAEALLAKMAGSDMVRKMLREESKALTEIGNQFHIRHSEVKQQDIQDEAHVEYLFHRLFSFMWLGLKKIQ